MSLLKSSRNLLPKDTTIHHNSQSQFNKDSSPLDGEIDINEEGLLTNYGDSDLQKSPPYEESHEIKKKVHQHILLIVILIIIHRCMKNVI